MGNNNKEFWAWKKQRFWSRMIIAFLLVATVLSVLGPQQIHAVDVNGEAGSGIPGANSVSGGYRIRRTAVPIAFR